MTSDVKCDSSVLVAACTRNTSMASTGLNWLEAVLAKNGLAEALVSVLATCMEALCQQDCGRVRAPLYQLKQSSDLLKHPQARWKR
jgi:hypothetical protein